MMQWQAPVPGSSKNSLESLFAKDGLRGVGAGGLTQDDVKTVQQNAAGVWGVPKSHYSPPKNGGQGVEKPLDIQSQLVHHVAK